MRKTFRINFMYSISAQSGQLAELNNETLIAGRVDCKVDIATAGDAFYDINQQRKPDAGSPARILSSQPLIILPEVSPTGSKPTSRRFSKYK